MQELSIDRRCDLCRAAGSPGNLYGMVVPRMKACDRINQPVYPCCTAYVSWNEGVCARHRSTVAYTSPVQDRRSEKYLYNA